MPAAVIAGLDPAIHLLRNTLAKWMDARVKPGHDASKIRGQRRKTQHNCG
jgi:hypothetical protein